MLVIALLIGPPTAAGAGASNCGQATAAPAAARVRCAAVRQSRGDTTNNEKSCRAYSVHFYEAVTARQAVSTCKDGVGRQPPLDAPHAEIDA